jgi:glycosyltransferase involved in cell wall biosynthesis
MKRLPLVCVLIPTYNRPWVLRQVIENLRKHLLYDGRIKFYIGFDGDKKHAKMFSGDSDIIAVPGPNNGLGANLNRLINEAPSNYLLQLDDDHLLTCPLDLSRHVRKLKRDKLAGWIRLMGVGYHDYIAVLDEDYWRVLWQSPETYIASNRPHLKHGRFHKHFGLYPEGASLAETETGFCQRCKDIGRGPDVLVPLDTATESGWKHIGESWQLKGF